MIKEDKSHYETADVHRVHVDSIDGLLNMTDDDIVIETRELVLDNKLLVTTSNNGIRIEEK
jgi:hypothetical protein